MHISDTDQIVNAAMLVLEAARIDVPREGARVLIARHERSGLDDSSVADVDKRKRHVDTNG